MPGAICKFSHQNQPHPKKHEVSNYDDDVDHYFGAHNKTLPTFYKRGFSVVSTVTTTSFFNLEFDDDDDKQPQTLAAWFPTAQPSPHCAVTQTTHTMSFFQVTLTRSAIGLPQRTRDALAALGLKRRNQTVVHTVSPSSAGLIFSVKELVKVKEVSEGREATMAKIKEARRPDPGFVIARKYHDINNESRQEPGTESSS